MIEFAPYYFIKNNILFVHGGFNPSIAIEKNDREFVIWDRNIIQYHKIIL